MSIESVNYQILSGKLITENSELKDELSHATQELNDIYHMVEQYPNDMKLGGKVRQLYWENTEEVENVEEEPVYIYESPDEGKTLYRREMGETARERMEEPPVSRERAEARLNYLNTELAHQHYWDGWTVKSMQEEKESLENQLKGNQMEIPFEE
mgnify:CR=1 FL=1